MLLFSVELLLHFLKRFGWYITKNSIHLAQDRDQCVPFGSLFLDRFLHDGGDISFNCPCNHQTSVSGISLSRFNSNGIEVTDLHADTAADTGFIIDVMDLSAFAGDGLDR